VVVPVTDVSFTGGVNDGIVALAARYRASYGMSRVMLGAPVDQLPALGADRMLDQKEVREHRSLREEAQHRDKRREKAHASGACLGSASRGSIHGPIFEPGMTRASKCSPLTTKYNLVANRQAGLRDGALRSSTSRGGAGLALAAELRHALRRDADPLARRERAQVVVFEQAGAGSNHLLWIRASMVGLLSAEVMTKP
jgi:hypothetical protein